MEQNSQSSDNQPIGGGPLEVHTMPQRFMAPPASGKKAKTIGLLIIIGVLTIFLGGAAFYLNYALKKNSQTTNNANNQIAKNINTNQPVNTNLNNNQNINQAVNNANTNTNENLNANTNTNTNINVEIDNELSLPAILPSSLDSDNDGLTDEEEKIYGTDPQKPDTDNDGYIDGAEALNFYNPASTGKLADSNLADVFNNSGYQYSLIYPVSWTMEVTESSGREVMFTSQATNEFVKIFVQDEMLVASALEWYLMQWPGLEPFQLKTIVVNGLNGVWSLDELTVYFVKNNKLYIINYGVGNKTEANFKTTFQMMVDSFQLKN